MEVNVNMDVHFNAYKVKYDTLTKLFRPVFTSQSIRRVNVYINLDDIFHTLHRPLVAQEFQMCGTNAGKQFIANILNLIGHYRQWFTRQHVECSVFSVYTSAKSFKNRLYVPDYRRKFREYMDQYNTDYYFVNETIRSSMDMLRVFSQYIEGVYIIDSKQIEPSVIPYFISVSESIDPADWNFVVSRDMYDFQYAYLDKFSLICPRGDITQRIDKSNIWEIIRDREKISTEKYPNPNFNIELFPIAYATVGEKYRTIPRVKRIGWKTIFAYMQNAMDAYKAFPPNSISLLILRELYKRAVDKRELENNIAVVSIPIQAGLLGEIDRASVSDQLIDIPDKENLKQLTVQYFYNHPINLEFLLQRINNQEIKRNPFIPR